MAPNVGLRYQLQMYPRISAFIALRVYKIQKVPFQNNLRLIHEFSGTFMVETSYSWLQFWSIR